MTLIRGVFHQASRIRDKFNLRRFAATAHITHTSQNVGGEKNYVKMKERERERGRAILKGNGSKSVRATANESFLSEMMFVGTTTLELTGKMNFRRNYRYVERTIPVIRLRGCVKCDIKNVIWHLRASLSSTTRRD